MLKAFGWGLRFTACRIESIVGIVEVERSSSGEQDVLVARLDETIAAVNDSTFGPSANVFTGRLEQAHRFADGVNTGQVSASLPTSGWDVHMPFGGGDSGSAFSEQGLEGRQFYTRVKALAIDYGA